jgi:hypothetical protein
MDPKSLVNNIDRIHCKRPKLKKQSKHGGVFHVSKLEFEGGPLLVSLDNVKVLSSERENVICIKLADADITNMFDIENHVYELMVNKLEIDRDREGNEGVEENFVSNVVVSNGRGKTLKCAFAAKYPCLASCKNRVCNVVLKIASIKYSEYATRLEWEIMSFDEVSPLDFIKSNEHSESEAEEDEFAGPSSDDIRDMHAELMGRLDSLIKERHALLDSAVENKTVLLKSRDINDINRIASELS